MDSLDSGRWVQSTSPKGLHTEGGSVSMGIEARKAELRVEYEVLPNFKQIETVRV
jgi:hypothetical protein